MIKEEPNLASKQQPQDQAMEPQLISSIIQDMLGGLEPKSIHPPAPQEEEGTVV